jgi:hypothetical protein
VVNSIKPAAGSPEAKDAIIKHLVSPRFASYSEVEETAYRDVCLKLVCISAEMAALKAEEQTAAFYAREQVRQVR